MFDTFLLIIRNLFQFGRLALVMRKYVVLSNILPPPGLALTRWTRDLLHLQRSGKNVFTQPAPIDLSSARSYSFSLDLDLDDEEAILQERRANGGDLEAQTMVKGGGGGATREGNARREAQPFLIDSDDEE